MSFTATQIIALRAPQFSADTRLAGLLELAAQMTSTTAFGTNYQTALALRVMHWLAMEVRNGGVSGTSSGSGTGGVIQSESEGQLSRSYGFISAELSRKYPDLMTTQYGQELVGLVRGNILGPRNRTIETER